MSFTLPGLIFNIVGVLAILRSEWLQKQAAEYHKGFSAAALTHGGRGLGSHGESVSEPEDDADAAFSLWMLGGLSLLFGFGLQVAGLFS